ncbi:hypothetical protein L0P88_08740 [Muricauda sp. SCSIO 64092]|uniref:hypothetical protein n=1 Tax=Allomuricauda sp. SCSIO 64092 TaxID=2908842 RepID=UPI001FF1C4D6|nr:hypothetical protein [Muricauda sp. SCSIO 64092]UOY08626.1 hypothetical protein L0P88_08740 [Muricauda sp. SCSIO 64092]
MAINDKAGIGIHASDFKRTPKGNIHAQAIKVNLSLPGLDDVFKESYDLKSPEEVQNHIQQHGHLPNIPSAQEVEENGIQLGEMNKLLLEKIAELTLYTIQQQKEIYNYQKNVGQLVEKLEALRQ